MKFSGFIDVILGRVEPPIFVYTQTFDVLFHIFPNPISYVGEIEDRVQKFCDTHILKENLNQDLILESVVGYLFEKQDEHSLTKIEEIELKRLTLLLKLDHECI